MRGMSKADLQDAYQRTDRELGATRRILRYLVTEQKPDAVERFSADGWRYTVKLFDSRGAVGGYVLIVGQRKGQGPDIFCEPFEAWAHYWRERGELTTLYAEGQAFRSIGERFREVQRKLFAEVSQPAA
jgi:hypothetical protein